MPWSNCDVVLLRRVGLEERSTTAASTLTRAAEQAHHAAESQGSEVKV